MGAGAEEESEFLLGFGEVVVATLVAAAFEGVEQVVFVDGGGEQDVGVLLQGGLRLCDVESAV